MFYFVTLLELASSTSAAQLGEATFLILICECANCYRGANRAVASISGKSEKNPSVGISSFEVADCYTVPRRGLSPGVRRHSCDSAQVIHYVETSRGAPPLLSSGKD